MLIECWDSDFGNNYLCCAGLGKFHQWLCETPCSHADHEACSHNWNDWISCWHLKILVGIKLQTGKHFSLNEFEHWVLETMDVVQRWHSSLPFKVTLESWILQLAWCMSPLFQTDCIKRNCNMLFSFSCLNVWMKRAILWMFARSRALANHSWSMRGFKALLRLHQLSKRRLANWFVHQLLQSCVEHEKSWQQNTQMASLLAC